MNKEMEHLLATMQAEPLALSGMVCWIIESFGRLAWICDRALLGSRDRVLRAVRWSGTTWVDV